MMIVRFLSLAYGSQYRTRKPILSAVCFDLWHTPTACTAQPDKQRDHGLTPESARNLPMPFLDPYNFRPKLSRDDR